MYWILICIVKYRLISYEFGHIGKCPAFAYLYNRHLLFCRPLQYCSDNSLPLAEKNIINFFVVFIEFFIEFWRHNNVRKVIENFFHNFFYKNGAITWPRAVYWSTRQTISLDVGCRKKSRTMTRLKTQWNHSAAIYVPRASTVSEKTSIKEIDK